MSELSRRNKEKINFGIIENLGLYERFEEILKLMGTYNKTVEKSNTHKKVYRRKLAEEVRGYRTEAISKAVLLFGRIN